MTPLRALLWLAVSTPEQAEDDKESLPTQERELTQIARARGWQIVDVLRVPGFSRSYFRLEDFAAEAKKEQIEAGEKLIYYMDYPRFKSPRFDVLVVRDADRFGRTQSLLTLIAESILVGMGKLIYVQNGNQLIDQSNASWFISMSSFKSSNEIATLVKRYKDGIRGRAMRGIPHMPIPHPAYEYRYDDKHTIIDMLPNEANRPLFEAIFDLVVNQRVSWYRLESELFRQYGIGRDGQPYHHARFQKLVCSATFHGHSSVPNALARGHKMKPTSGLWFVEPGHPIPPHLDVFYNTHEAYFTGQQGERWRAELRRRHSMSRGRAHSDSRYWMTGLFICGGCGCYMGVSPRQPYYYARCHRTTNGPLREIGKGCTNTQMLREDRARQYVHERLAIMLQQGIPDAFLPDLVNTDRDQQRLEQLDKSIAALRHKLSRLIDRQIEANEVVYQTYAEKIVQVGAEIERLLAERESLAGLLQSAHPDDQSRGYQQIEHISLDHFWQQSPGWVNQVLHLLMGNRRFVVVDAQIVATADAPSRGHQGPRRRTGD